MTVSSHIYCWVWW